jgi:tetratricopeptide (TPR) repeat protein
VDDRFYAGLAACFAGMIAVARGDVAAEVALEQSAALWRMSGYPRGMALTLGAQSRPMLGRGEVGAALVLAGEALRLCAGQRDRWGVAFALPHLGAAALAQGDAAEAGYLFAESAETAREVGEQWVRCHALAGGGRAAIAAGRTDDARGLLREAQEIADAARLKSAALEVLLGEALLHAAENVEDALTQLAHVAQHPAAEHHIREEARREWIVRAGPIGNGPI